MTILSNSRGAMVSRRSQITLGTRTKRRKRQFMLEGLENRTLLAYTFALAGQTATVSPVAATGGPILIDEVMVGGVPLLEHSQDNGVTFSTDWDDATPGIQTLAAAATSTINLTPTTGAGSSITLGDLVSPASNIFALFHLGVVGTPANNSLTIDDRTSVQPAGTYDFFGTLGTITGPGGAAGGINFTSFGPINSYLLEGGPGANTYNIHSTFNATIASTTIVGGAADDTANVLGDTSPGIGTPLSIDLGGGTNTVHVGNGNLGATIFSPVTVNDTGGTTSLSLDDQNNTTHSPATLDNLSGNVNAPFEVKGLSGGPIEYAASVTALNINGGTFGATGVTYNINNTQAGTTTTINGGPNSDTFNLSPGAENLSDLAGPVVINGNGGTNTAVLFDQNGAGGSYAIDATTVAAPGFAGLTYGTLSDLTLNSSNNPSTVDVNNTASGVTTTVNTGTGGSTVNVLATSAALDIVGGAVDTVNIGSTGGPGDMANIQGPISVSNPPSLTALNFHDENDVTGQTWTLDNDDGVPTGSVAVTGSATTTYNPLDLSGLTVNGGSGGNTFTVNNTSAFYPTTLNTGTGNDTVNVFATGNNTLDIHGQSGQDAVTLGGDPLAGMQNLTGTITVDNTLAFSTLVLDDSENPAGLTDATLTDNGTNGSVTGLAPATINYTDNDINSTDPTVDSLKILLSNGGSNTFTVDGTLASANHPPVLTELNKGTGVSNTVFVNTTNANSVLNITGGVAGGGDFVTINANMASIQGAVNLDEVPGSTNLVIDLSTDGLPHVLDLSSNGTTSTLHDELGNLPNDITYITASLASVTIDTDPTQNQTLNLNFGGGGNPIPTFGSPGLIYNADGLSGASGSPGVTHILNILGELPTGPFASETHNANDPAVIPTLDQYGSIFFTDAAAIDTSLDYTGLLPINDTTPAVDYTFNDFADDNSFTALGAPTAPVVLGFQTIQFSNTPVLMTPPTFETTNIANKTNVIFNTNTAAGINGVVNITTPSTGLASLTFNTPTSGDNTVSFVNTPPGVITSLGGGNDEDVTNVTGQGLPAGNTVLNGDPLFLNGGGAINTLNYDTGGLTPTITAGALPGEIIIMLPGFGDVDATNYQQINIIGLGPLVITPGPAVTINSVEGFQNVDAIVGTFTAPVPVVPAPAGFPASDFTASIDWGDPSPDLAAGTITQDASNPSVYYITGTHTFADTGSFTVANTVAFAGGTISIPVGGVPISFTFGPAGPTPGTPATAVVTQGPLAVSAFPIVGTEGAVIPSAPIATFIDAGGADPVADYSATINILNSTNTLVVSVAAASITQNADAAQYTVVAPDITLPEEGTYQVQVVVTDADSATPITVAGASVAVIADAALTAGPAVLLTPNTGVALPATTVVGTFTDANPAAPISDFTATIDWGDGSPNSVGTISQPGGVGTAFDVTGGHNYARFGTYTTTVVVTDVGGSTVTLVGSATVTDPVITGTGHNFTSVEGTDSGPVVLATIDDPNTLATAADITAMLTAWGDGTPPSPVPLTVVQVSSTPTDTVFNIIGHHNYHEEGSFTFSLSVTTLDPANLPPLVLTGTATVTDAALSSSNGTEIRGIEGTAPGAVGPLLGTFTDANPFATADDFTGVIPGGSIVVNWGDGTAPQTLTAANITPASPTPVGLGVFSINAPHTYAEEGTYAYTVTVTDAGGSVTIFSGSAIIADAALAASAVQPTVSTTEGGSGGEAGLYPVPVFGLPTFNGPVGSFTDGDPTAPVSDVTAIIDWGDGTPPSAGTISQPGGVGTAMIVSGAHTYADAGVNGGAGTYPIQVFVVDAGGSRLTISNTATVADRPIVLTGQLNPASDSGVSNTDDITNVKQPDFFGSSEPLSHVTLFETPTGGAVPVPIGQVEAGSDGSWNIVSRVPLADGTYVITATATDQFGVTTTTAPTTITANLVIDTVGPVITGAFFNRLNGEVDYTIQDPGLASGVRLATLLDSSNYLLTKVHANKAFPGKWIATSIIVTPGAAPNSEDVAVVFNNGRIIQGGFYLFTIRDSSNGNSSVQDIAGNHLDGVFYGSFPSGNGIPGSDFVAMLSGYHDKIFAPQTIVGTANAANGGNGGPPIGAVHSGDFVTAVPRGGGSVFGGDPKHLAGTVKAHHATARGRSLVNHHAVAIKLHGTHHASKIKLGKHTPKGPLQG